MCTSPQKIALRRKSQRAVETNALRLLVAMASSSDSSSSSSDSEERRKKREKKERRKERKKERKKEKSHKKEKKSKHKKRKAGEDGERSRKKLRETASGSSWGKHGIIRESDMYEKQEEFLAWLTEVKGVPQDQCTQRELKAHFETFCEDYNTATLPSKKYYNLAAWAAKERHRAAEDHARAAASFERNDFDDEAARQREIRAAQAKRSAELTSVMARSMKAGEGLVADMNDQAQLRFQSRQAYAIGDTDRARALVEKLDPTRVTEEELRAKFGGPAPMNSKKPGGMKS